jgi:hypothetical protein
MYDFFLEQEQRQNAQSILFDQLRMKERVGFLSTREKIKP